MHILITGGTGFIGTELRTMLLREGHILTIITRSPDEYEKEAANNQRFIDWEADLPGAMNEADAVINLAGAPIFGKRWTEEVKKAIYESRIGCTRQLVDAMHRADSAPSVFVSASGINYYRDGGDEVLDEDAPEGDGFLSRVCRDWEEASRGAKEAGVRVVNPRLAVVLETGGGALKQMLPPFKMFVGGPIGRGGQYFSWIHMLDICRGLVFPLDKEIFEGPYNLAAPNPVTMNEFADALGEVLGRPSLFRVPEPVLKGVLGEAAAPVLESLRIHPKKLLQAGYEFKFKHVREALADIL